LQQPEQSDKKVTGYSHDKSEWEAP